MWAGTRIQKNRAGGVLSPIATLIFLVVFVVTLVFLTIYLGLMYVKGGIASLTVDVKSDYSDERTLLYLTDEYGNKLTDLIGQAVLYTSPQITVTGDITTTDISAYAIDNSQYQCSTGGNLVGGTYDPTYKVSHVDLNRYLRCYIIPNKLGAMYSKDTYCLFAVYGKDGPNATFGNDKLSSLPGCGGGAEVSADIAPPPGYTNRISMRLEKA